VPELRFAPKSGHGASIAECQLRAIKRRIIAVAAVLATAVTFAFPISAATQTKVALIIGNGAYKGVPELTNPTNDATAVAGAFLRLGFSVRLVADASYDDMRRALLEFSQKARDSEMAVVFFAGHGIELGGENWLVPVDAELKTDLDTEQEAISLRSVMLMVSAASKLGVVMLDACRNNPFINKVKRSIATRAVTRGLSRVEPMNNVLVAYAAKDGTTASDGSGDHSPFTTALLKYIETPGLEITFLFRNVRDDVIAATGNEQLPFVYGSLSKEAIYFKPPPAAAAPVAPDQITWSLIKDTTDETALKRFTTQYPKSELRKDAEARIAALEAAQAAKPVPPKPDETTWALLKETTDEAALKRFMAQYPNSTLRKDAEARVAALAAAQAAKPTPPGPDEVTWALIKETTDEGALKRFAAQYPNSALRKDADARIAALEAAQAAKPVPPSPDEVTWAMLKETTDEAALKRFTAQYPKSLLRKDAEARIAALVAAQAAKPVPPSADEVTWALLEETTDEAALKRFTAQYPKSPLRKDADARIAALEAAQAAKPVPPNPDEVTWALLKETTDEAALKRFTNQYPNSTLRQEAEARIAALEATPKPVTGGAADAHELARSLQLELKRVGCFNGAINGQFDDATKAAWRSFSKQASISLPDDVSFDAIKAVRGFDRRICPLTCPNGQRPEGDRCVAGQSPGPKVPASAATNCLFIKHNGHWCMTSSGWVVR
jgi:outer membrane protein assembly factor BamD (BamD/ComL family)